MGVVEVKIAPLKLLQVVRVRGSIVATNEGSPELLTTEGKGKPRCSCCSCLSAVGMVR